MVFRFRLEKALHFIKLKETMKKMELATIVERISSLEARKRKLKTTIDELLERTAKDLSPQWLSYQSTKIMLDHAQISKVDDALKIERKSRDTRSQELMMILSRKKALESLREKKNREFKRTEARKSQHALDETYGMWSVKP